MDILHLKPREIRQIPIEDYLILVDYCWKTYTQRRVDFNLVQLLGDGKKGGKGPKRTIDWSALNPAHQAFQKKKKYKKQIPKKFLESLK